jgi:hypothetical protein
MQNIDLCWGAWACTESEGASSQKSDFFFFGNVEFEPGFTLEPCPHPFFDF